MRQYTLNTDGVSRDALNIALLGTDIHQVFAGHKFAVVPKPFASRSSPSPRAAGSTSFALTVHVLESDHEACEFCSLYHDALQARDVRLDDEKIEKVKGNRVLSRQESRTKNRDVCRHYSYFLRPTFLN